MSAVTSQSLSTALTVIYANIEGLTAAKASILSEMCKRECCHCLYLQETHRSTNLPRPKIAGMSLVVERHTTSMIVLSSYETMWRWRKFTKESNELWKSLRLWCLELLYTMCTSHQTTRLNSQLWATETYHILWLEISTATVLRGVTQAQITKEKR